MRNGKESNEENWNEDDNVLTLAVGGDGNDDEDLLRDGLPRSVTTKESISSNKSSCDISYSDFSDRSGSSKKTEANKNIWSRLVRQAEIWDFDDSLSIDFEYDPNKKGTAATIKGRFFSCAVCPDSVWHSCSWARRIFKTAFTYPSIIAFTLILFIFLCISAVALVIKLTNDEEVNRRNESTDVAEETGAWFSSELDNALLPLFTMSQFVMQLSDFHHLPFDIGNRGEFGSAPPVLGDKYGTHRNMTGIISPELEAKFHEIASGVKKAANMGGILVGIQLAPQAVVSLVHPLNNTEDFPSGLYLDSTSAIGHDLLNDPKRVAIAQATVPAPGVVIAGPLKLIQGDVPTVNECFIARLAINMPGNVPSFNLTVDGVSYESWGFAVALINWEALKDRSHIYERFKERNLFFKLTRNDEMYDKDTNSFYHKEIVIAESPNAEQFFQSHDDTEDVRLDTTNNEWIMKVGREDGFRPCWEKWGIPVAVIGSLIICVMFMVILVAKKEHEALLFKMMPFKAIKKLRRGETVVEKYDMVTIFFCDIVGFTAMAGEMTPIEVMEMLNELYTQLDELVKKHEVYKVETIGDSYMVLGGAPKRLLGPESAARVASFAIDVIEHVKTFRTSVGDQVFIRAGLASGPVVAGVVGTEMPRYCMFGDTVNLASRMESTSRRMKIQCSGLTARLLCDSVHIVFDLEERREGNKVGVEVKGKGRQNTFWIKGAKPRASVGFKIPKEVSAPRLETASSKEKDVEKLRTITLDTDNEVNCEDNEVNCEEYIGIDVTDPLSDEKATRSATS